MSKLEATKESLRILYESDTRPWVVAYSGGKDSTAVLQLVYELLMEEQAAGKSGKPVFVVSSDTGVEAPNVAQYVSSTLSQIGLSAKKQRLDLSVELVTPEADEEFWSKLIGLGYPPPTRWFRWCTTNMKIKPSRRAIDAITRKHGSVILLLGTRSNESVSRGNAIAARETNQLGLNRHHEIPDALVATPIVDWTTDEVWDYLYSYPPPWGGSHDFMLSLYRQANGGECPVVLDLNTPSCGGSRFGCWTCTVVKEDKSMQGFIHSGEEKLQPLANFRDWLKAIREDAERRSPLRRDGKSAGPGPFNPNTRMEILEKLLTLEQGVGFPLISDESLAFIQKTWREEFDYSDMARQIASRFGRENAMDKPFTCLQSDDPLLEVCARDADFPLELAQRLLETVKSQYAYLDRWGAKTELERDITALIEKDIEQAKLADPAHDL
ncbi:DNA phosphorothioation system sulfurtransferase DndC [uncultured Zoogloea sp.]|uniref:DNA phosphorothioation system sulfurtransferase DndC n=1 Tax=uncultured Zoogloea sp. TaxID=160237 RepID=UPI0026046858|nr:DNA phosphorothioation system sulfurtransferase DndC [uncultured Zoogloea sp.]